MPIGIACPHCGNHVMLADQMGGQAVPCPRCGRTIMVPFSAIGAGMMAAPPPASKSSALWWILGSVGVVLLLCCGGGVWFVWWVVSTARDTIQEAVAAAESQAETDLAYDSLSEISQAMHSFHDAHQAFPAHASFDDTGKPLLSWRVHLLPFLGEDTLYQQFHLDEPWDSPHNKTLLDRMPRVYQSPGADWMQGKTRFVVALGAETPFPLGPGRDAEKAVGNVGIKDIQDGTSNTILVFMAPEGQEVVWTKPEDWPYSADQVQVLRDYLSSEKTIPFALADGDGWELNDLYDAETIRRLFEKADGQPVQWPEE
jgi:hypothetical protein